MATAEGTYRKSIEASTEVYAVARGKRRSTRDNKDGSEGQLERQGRLT